MGLTLILILLLLGGIGGGAYELHEHGIAQGKEECEAAHQKADADLAAKGKVVELDFQDHVNDMVIAYDQGKKDADKKVVSIKSQGAKDVTTYPVFNNPVCVLPADSLRNLNSARTGTGTAPAPAVADGAVRESATPQAGHVAGTVPPDAGGRRPRGKVQ